MKSVSPKDAGRRRAPVKIKKEARKLAPLKARKLAQVKSSHYRALLRRATPMERVTLEREGVPAGVVSALLKKAGMTTGELQRLAGMPKTTYTKKMREKAPFVGTPGQSVIGLMDLINRVEDMLDVANKPEAWNFNVEKWVAKWVTTSQPAMGGMAPMEVMDTPTGRESVMKLLGSIQSGAYQ